MEKDAVINKLSSLINEHISKGFALDTDTIRFIESAYGLSEANEIADFLENDSDEAILGMISYPPENFRGKIEKFIPSDGVSLDDIKKIEDSVNTLTQGCFIFFNKKIPLSKKDSNLCCKKFIRRLYLNVSLNFISNDNLSKNDLNLFAIKALLRKKKFSSNVECSNFINDLISNLQIAGNDLDEEYLRLIDLLSDFFNGSDKNPFDILAEKRDFYVRALLEYEEFNNLLKSYSMEFIMMKRIRAPIVSVDEAMYIIKSIDKITRIAYKVL